MVCDRCGHHYLGTSAKSERYNYYSCRTYLQKGREACDAAMLNKEKLETAALDQIHEQILSEENVRRYIELVLQQARRSDVNPSAEEQALKLTLTDLETRIRR
jgi:hypothetical protein